MTSLLLLCSRPLFSFSISASSGAQLILKQFYSTRLTLQPHNYSQYLLELTKTSNKHRFRQEDHRWLSLVNYVEKNVAKNMYDRRARVYMLKGLLGINSQMSVVVSLFQGLEQQIQSMNLQECVVFLWCMSQNSQKKFTSNTSILSLFKRIRQLLMVSEGESQESIESVLPLRVMFRGTARTAQDSTQISPETHFIQISATQLAMILTGMSKLGILDKPLLKRLLNDGIKPSLQSFDTQSLCIFLVQMAKLGLINRRVTISMYQTIRKRTRDLQQKVTVKTLYNLLPCLANMSKRQPHQQEKELLEKYRDQNHKMNEQQKDMKLFFLWLCQTITIRQPLTRCQDAALILCYANKIDAFDSQIWLECLKTVVKHIEEANITDLVMTLHAVANRPQEQRKLFQKEEEAVSQRLWRLSSSINKKSLDIIYALMNDKKIDPPVKIAKLVKQRQEEALLKREKMRQNVERKRSQNSRQLL